MTQIRIAVVGGGISGLATAWYLERGLSNAGINNASVHVLDAGSHVGGVIQTLSSDHSNPIATDYSEPYLIELGADNFATLLPDAMQLVREMGLESEFITPKKNFRIAQVVHNGKLYPIPNGFSLMQPTRMGAILATPILSLPARLRVLSEAFVKPKTDNEDESVASFAIRRLGKECFERLVEPIVGGIFTAKAETLSMQAAMPQFVRMEQEYGSLIRAALAKRRNDSAEGRSAREASGARYDQFVAPKRGMSWWLEELARPLGDRLQLQFTATSLRELASGQWELKYLHSGRGHEHIEIYDAVCLALPSYRSAELLSHPYPNVAMQLNRIPYASSAIAVLALTRAEIKQDAFCFGSISPSIEHRDCLAISLSSEKYSGRCPDDTILARVFMGGALRPDLLEQDDESLLKIAKQEVAELFGPHSKPKWERVVRWERAMPQYLVGHLNLVREIRTQVSQLETLELTSNAFDGVGIPQCVRGAKQAAERLIDKLHRRLKLKPLNLNPKVGD